MNRRPEMIPPLFHPASPIQPPPLRGTSFHRKEGRRECTRKPLPLEGATERSEAGLASFFGGEAASSLPSPLGKGDRAAVDRVLSLIVDLRCISSLSFIPLPPIQPPPLRGTSFHRKEGVSTRAPSLGRGCRAQRGGVGFLFSAALGCSRISST